MNKYFKSVFLLLFALVFVQFTFFQKFNIEENAGLMLPEGFQAITVADSLGSARHLAVNENGDIYVKLRALYSKGGNVALRDTNQDGRADIIKYFSQYPDTYNYGTAMRIHDGYIYYSSSGQVLRQKLIAGQLLPDPKVEMILDDDFKNDIHGYNHTAKPVTFDQKGYMYVPFGSPGDVCQPQDRVPGVMGQYPCPQLEEHAGVWVFDPNKLNQTIKDGKRYATGIRSAVAVAWNFADNNLYLVQHGRDDLHRTWPEKYDKWQSALLPSEEFLRIKEGANAGWPYYYYDQIKGKKLLNPEYGGDGKKEGKGKDYEQPLIGFPGHWAPNDLLFYTGNMFPERYKNGAFITFHGSTIRGPYSQAGYFVGFVPFANGSPSGPWEVFADGFSGIDAIVNTSDAKYRPMGLAQGPDGAIYISDSQKGKVWKVVYKGDKNKFGTTNLAFMESRKQSAHIRNPDFEKDRLVAEAEGGKLIYETYCVACHLANGKGDGQRFPPLNNSEYVNGDKTQLINILLKGLNKKIIVKGKPYNAIMPSHSFLKDADIASVLTYIRQNFENNSSEIFASDVAKLRRKGK